jgi:transposase
MIQTASPREYTRLVKMYVALELGFREWKLAFSTGLGDRVFTATVAARDGGRFRAVMEKARERLGVPAGCEVVSCYEAGRDGFWVDRWLRSLGIENRVVDSSSIEVNRRSRRIKTDRIDARKLLSMLIRYELGERQVWSVVRVPSEAEEDGRHLHRELRTLKKEQTRLINRIKGLLASQGVACGMGRRGLLESLEKMRRWDGSGLPEGLRRRVEAEVARHGFVHGQLLECEAQSRQAVGKRGEKAAAEIRRLSQLRAVGRHGATVLVREFGWRGFRNRRELGALAGLVPTPFQSGDSFREGGISRAGNRHVRGIIVDLAWGWVRLQPGSQLSCWYRRRFAAGSSRLRRIGIVALARKLLIALWRYWEYGQLPQGAVLKPSAA